MEEKKGEGEHKTHSNTEHQTHHPSKKQVRLNKTRIAIALVILAIIAIIVLYALGILVPKGTSSEIVKVGYSIYDEETNILVEQDEKEFTQGFISDTLAFESSIVDEEVKKMSIGDEKTITLDASEAYGKYDDSLIYEINRTDRVERKKEMDKITELTIDEFKDYFNEEPILNKEYELSGAVWKYKVIELDNENVKVEALAKIGDKIPTGIPGIEAVVTSITTDKIITLLEGEKVEVPASYGTIEIFVDNTYVNFRTHPYTDREITMGEYTGYVTKLTDTKITIDGNHPYAGKTIRIELNLVSREKGSAVSGKVKIPGAPTFQFFIMSYCPYGVQMLKGVLPVWKEFDDKANIELRFVGYTMHGQQEEDENYRMICIREEQYSKLIAYAECFSQTDEPLTCMNNVGVDKGKVDDCMANRAAGYYEVDKELGNQYGVTGSPTTVIDGQVVSVYPRDPQTIANFLCEAFSSPPSECSKTFSTENPSPGFGGGTGSSGGSCG